ncbi:MAG TPA: molybdenum cofactor biosynthesis protein MoaE [Anaerolineales bacterium]|nr:molybdenum cofactor biosynthesis protein MoaE [Anaerolineales bacterium]
MNQITIRFFATFKDRAGTSETRLDLPDGAAVAELKARLGDLFPALAPALGSALVSVNREYAFDQDVLPEAAEVALFPPVSGGGQGPTLFYITESEIDLNVLLGEITLPSTGAACIFSGMVRAETARHGPSETEFLEYETYREMAEAKMEQVADEIRSRWPDVLGIAVVQRIGRLYPGTPTVLIACSAAHRDTGVFEAAKYGIDRLKEIVPIWKKEIGPGGQEWVEGAYRPVRGD